MSCLGLLPAGINQECQKTAGNLKMPIFTDVEVEFDSLNDAKLLSNWAPFITDLKVWAAPLYDYENNTEDPNVITAFSTDKMQTNNPQIAYSIFLKVNPCDWRNVMSAFDGKTYRMFELYQNGGIAATQGADFKVRGFLVDVYATFKGAGKDDFNVYRIDVYFKDTVTEVKQQGVMFEPSFEFYSEYFNLAPVSHRLTQISPVVNTTAADFTVQVDKCGGGATEGLLVADFEVTATTVSGITISNVAAAASGEAGQYDVTLSATLTQFEFIDMRVNKGTPPTDVSNVVRIKGTA